MAAYQGRNIGFVLDEGASLQAHEVSGDEMVKVPAASLAAAANYIHELEKKVAMLAGASFRPVSFYKMQMKGGV
jgi:hypothetical protein